MAQATNNLNKRSIGGWLTVSLLLTLALCSQAFATPVSYAYDNLNRLTEVNYNNGQQIITYTYDAAGNIETKEITMANIAPTITEVNPVSGLEGTSISATGNGFNGTTSVLFHSFPSGRESEAAFSVVNDGLIETTVPGGYPFDFSSSWFLTVFSDAGAAVAVPDTVITVSGISGGGGSSAFLVENGGILTGGFGSSVVFVRSGGSYTNTGGGGNLIFVEDGGAFSGNGGGGGNTVFYEPLANIINTGGGSFTELSSLTFTVLGQTAPMLDTDGDGLPDDWEITNFGDLVTADSTTDSDNDGLLDIDEYGHGTNPNNTDTDGDGDSDGNEVLYGADPTDTLDTLDSYRPNTPVILPIAGDAVLRDQTFDVEGFTDPDQFQGDYLTASKWEISTDQNFTNGNSIFYKILERSTDDSEVDYRQLLMPDNILVKATDYWVRTRHQDSVGLWSAWSAPLAFSTVAIDSNDLDDDSVDDRYQVTGYTDTDGNSVDDSMERIRALYEAEGGATIGIRAGSGTLGSLTAVPSSDIPTGQMPTDPMPYGLFSFRIDGLLVNAVNPATADVTFYFPESLPSEAKWYKYDPVSGEMTDFTANVVFSGNQAVVTLTDGGVGDADGVINGIIVDPSGPTLPVANSTVDEDNNASPASGGDSSGGCSLAMMDKNPMAMDKKSAIDPVLPLLLLWSLIYVLLRCCRSEK